MRKNGKYEAYVCVTLYHLYLSLLLINRNSNKENSVLFLSANDGHIYKQFCNLKKSLEEKGYNVAVRLRDKKKDILGLEGVENKKEYQLYQEMFGQKMDGKFVLYNFAWNLQYIYTQANLLFKKCRVAYFIEEGALTAINPAQPKLKILIKKITGTVTEYYKVPKLKKIFVQKPEIYPDEWKDKLGVLNVQKLVNALDPESAEVILEIFMGDFLNDIREGTSGNIGVIYTQPLSEDGFITEKEKIKYYHDMAKYYAQYARPVIKLHPRDLSTYGFDEDIVVFPAYFPSELLNLLSINFEYAVGICTSAVPTTNAKKRLNINENFLNDLKFQLKPLD